MSGNEGVTVRYPHLRRGIVLALLGGVCWGFSGNCGEVLLNVYGVSSQWLTCVRMVCAAVVFMACAAVSMRGRMLGVFRDVPCLVRIVVFGVAGIVLTQVTYLNAIHFVGAGVELLLEQLGLVLIMLYLCARTRRLPHAREVAGLACALVGMVLIATQGNLTALAIPAEGFAWGMASAVSLALYNLLPIRPLAVWGSLLTTGLAMTFGSVAACVAFQPWNEVVRLPPEGVAVLVAIVVVGTVLAYLFYIQGVKDAGPMRAGMLASVEPVSGIVISALWLGTPIGTYDVLGTIAIVAMIALVTQREDRKGQGEGDMAEQPRGRA